jgi:hypothetical protein
MTSGAMRRKLVFHIGHQKTGTTTIQNAFATGKVRLDDARIHFSARMAHNYLKNHVLRYASDGTVMNGRPGMPGLAEISDQLATERYDYAVFSGEAFADFDPAHLRKAMDRFLLPYVTDHSVLCYLRPHAARVLSSFVEQTKIGLHAGSIADFHAKSLKRGRFSYATKLSPWVATFGNHFVVRPMVREELAQGSVLRDFVQAAFGAGARARIDEESNANESLCVEDLMLLKIVQEVVSERSRNIRLELGWAIAAIFAELPAAPRKTTRLRLHRSLAERIRKDYLADARLTDQCFFAGKPILQRELDRAIAESVAEAMSVEPSDYLSSAEIRDVRVLAGLVNAMLDRQPKEWPAFFLDRRARLLQD